MPTPGQEPLRRPRYQANDLVGEKYVLVRPLGTGGMGTVWIARDRVLDVHVAVKLLALEGGDVEVHARRMLEEARTAARIGHAAIVRTLDFGLTRLGDPFLVMELLHGEDLADLLARERRLPALAAVSTLLPIAHGLATAHEGGIIHRDVKPENIFLAATDLGTQPKLLDFGIARFTDRMQRLTLEGVVLGTPDYISPEQARGEKVTPAADLWSYCVVLYELVTGRCPFQGESYYELLRAIVEQAPAPLVAHGVNEPELWRLLARGLSKRPSDRYPTLRELGQALAEWAIARGLQEDVTGTSLRRTWLRDAEGSVPDRLPVGVEPGAAPGSGADPEAAVSSRGVLSGRGARPGPEGSFTADEVPTDAELAALAAVSELGDPDDLFHRSNRRRLAAVIAVLVGLVALGVLLLLSSVGLLELGTAP